MKNLILISFFLFTSFLAAKNNKTGYEAFTNGNYQLAKELFTKEIKDNPNNAELYYNRALAELKLNQYDEAQKDFNKAKEIIN
jgi:tetratricopeptide (TPR) repeat protein